MTTLEFLRSFHFFGYAIFDLSLSFIGMYLLSGSLSKLFRKINIEIPKINWVYLTLPIGILVHIIVGTYTPMAKDFRNLNSHYILKIVILVFLFLGFKGIRRK
ncbi:hypothetical protein HXX01_01130 [Candidatus Nomurabacteria bacterium]|nr:hypothetical protein [Candidatus Nomurabacteria bacterium]